MTARVFCVVLLCLPGCLSSTEAAPGLNSTELNRIALKPSRVCPVIKNKIGLCAEFCSDDSDCAKNEKCCSNGCGHECTPLYTGRPKTQCEQHRDKVLMGNGGELPVGAFIPDCDEQGQYRPQQCHGSTGYCWCVDSAGQERAGTRTPPGTSRINCDEPEIKPGVCPSRRYTAKQCTWIRFVSCDNDRDCVKNEKCCNNGCGLQCMIPVTAVNPGVCPSRLYTTKECALIRFVPCGGDSDCAKNEKCCHNGCGLQCMAPVKVKPGLCPSKKYDAAMCPVIRFKPCANDSDCANNQKCCSNGCGLQCMAPFKDLDLVPVLIPDLN